MPPCERCVDRSGGCSWRCEREADGRHLWLVMQAEMHRGLDTADMPHLGWERQASDVRRAYVAGALAIKEMAR